MFLRFEARGGRGLFARAFELRDAARCRDVRMSRKDDREFHELLCWLTNRTPVPPREAYRDDLSRSPLTWWKLSARDHIMHAWRISLILCRYRHRVRPLHSHKPGTILFEDDVQVVVRPNRTNDRPAAKAQRRQPRWNGDRASIRRIRECEVIWFDSIRPETSPAHPRSPPVPPS